jgi:urease accessory protein
MSRLLLAAAAAALTPAAALAHAQPGAAAGFVSGFLHPFLGPDHLVAMVAVGLWGAQLGQPLLIALPIAFPLVMALGAVVGVAGVDIPLALLGAPLSAIALGLAVALALRPPAWVAVLAVSVFAIYHGHAHGAELPPAESPITYGIGFVTATGLLHLTGVGIGALAENRSWGDRALRAMGGVVAAVGAAFTAILAAGAA